MVVRNSSSQQQLMNPNSNLRSSYQGMRLGAGSRQEAQKHGRKTDSRQGMTAALGQSNSKSILTSFRNGPVKIMGATGNSSVSQ